jgi:arginine/lysine/ornithine decarboxylase
MALNTLLYFVTNGTSTANKIVMQALVEPGNVVLIDRDSSQILKSTTV